MLATIDVAISMYKLTDLRDCPPGTENGTTERQLMKYWNLARCGNY